MLTLLPSISISDSGSTDNELTFGWLEEFEDATKPEDLEAWRLLVIDGHGSHLTVKFLDYAFDHKIEVVGYPPHSTHILQGLGVVCFLGYKKMYKQYIQEHFRMTQRAVTKEVFLEALSNIVPRAFKPSVIQAAFRRTGIDPIDRTVVPADAVAPSEETSTQPMFPVEQDPIVAAILPYVEFVQDRVAARTPEPQEQSTVREGTQQTRIHHQVLTPEIREQAAEARKRLVQFPEGAILVGSDNAQATAELPPPVVPLIPHTPETARTALSTSPASTPQSLARENARLREALENERTRNSAQSRVLLCQNTKIFVQHMTLEQQNTRLYAKEQTRQSRKTKLLQTKHGRHLTGEKFREAGRLDEKEVRMKKQAAEMRKAKREQKKEVKKWGEAARIRRKAQQDADIEEWKAENMARVARGEKAVNKRPRMPPKERTPDIFKSEGSDCKGEAGVEAEDEEVEAEDLSGTE
jgi:hypothetical protein